MKKRQSKPNKKCDFIESSDDDFVNPSPGPSKQSLKSKKLISDDELKKKKNRERVAKFRASTKED